MSVSIVPGVIGPGSGPAELGGRQWAVIGKYGANKAGKKVVLQRQSGSSWKTVDKSEIDSKGQVVFAVSRHQGRQLPRRRSGRGQRAGEHRLLGHAAGLRRQLQRVGGST